MKGPNRSLKTETRQKNIVSSWESRLLGYKTHQLLKKALIKSPQNKSPIPAATEHKTANSAHKRNLQSLRAAKNLFMCNTKRSNSHINGFLKSPKKILFKQIPNESLKGGHEMNRNGLAAKNGIAQMRKETENTNSFGIVHRKNVCNSTKNTARNNSAEKNTKTDINIIHELYDDTKRSEKPTSENPTLETNNLKKNKILNVVKSQTKPESEKIVRKEIEQKVGVSEGIDKTPKTFSKTDHKYNLTPEMLSLLDKISILSEKNEQGMDENKNKDKNSKDAITTTEKFNKSEFKVIEQIYNHIELEDQNSKFEVPKNKALARKKDIVEIQKLQRKKLVSMPFKEVSKNDIIVERQKLQSKKLVSMPFKEVSRNYIRPANQTMNHRKGFSIPIKAVGRNDNRPENLTKKYIWSDARKVVNKEVVVASEAVIKNDIIVERKKLQSKKIVSKPFKAVVKNDIILERKKLQGKKIISMPFKQVIKNDIIVERKKLQSKKIISTPFKQVIKNDTKLETQTRNLTKGASMPFKEVSKNNIRPANQTMNHRKVFSIPDDETRKVVNKEEAVVASEAVKTFYKQIKTAIPPVEKDIEMKNIGKNVSKAPDKEKNVLKKQILSSKFKESETESETDNSRMVTRSMLRSINKNGETDGEYSSMFADTESEVESFVGLKCSQEIDEKEFLRKHLTCTSDDLNIDVKMHSDFGYGGFRKIIRNENAHLLREVSKHDGEVCFCDPRKEQTTYGCVSMSSCVNRATLVECDDRCKFRDRCMNKAIQSSKWAQVKLKKFEKKGIGVIADENLKTGQFITEYLGEIINGDEFVTRLLVDYKEMNNTYIFFVDEQHYIDATRMGCYSRFFNHSCDPNAYGELWTVNGEKTMAFFAKRNITKGEEITFNYHYENLGHRRIVCRCGSKNCTSFVGNNKKESNYKKRSSEAQKAENDPEDSKKSMSGINKEFKSIVERTPKKEAKMEPLGIELNKKIQKQEFEREREERDNEIREHRLWIREHNRTLSLSEKRPSNVYNSHKEVFQNNIHIDKIRFKLDFSEEKIYLKSTIKDCEKKMEMYFMKSPSKKTAQIAELIRGPYSHLNK